MGLDWDILYNDVSIADEVIEFHLKKSKNSYVHELNLYVVNPSFFDNISYTSLPDLTLEVKTKLEDTWISHGFFFIEKPIYGVTPRQKISSGIWGRSETAKLGQPFAETVTKTWIADTTFSAIITEMAALAGITVLYEIDEYPLYAHSYSVDMKYPIDVIKELCEFAGALITCNDSGQLVIKKDIYHTGTADAIVTDSVIRDITEKISYPEFGNRIKVSALSSNSGYSIEVSSFADTDCLPADGSAELIVLAFVTIDEAAAEDNLIVDWAVEDGLTLESSQSTTGTYLIEHAEHRASNYHDVTVDYPIESIIGIWAFADTIHANNFWNESLTGCSFEGKTITVHDPFTYCDQSLIISYITHGVAVNTVIAGSEAVDSEVKANIEGAEGSLNIKLGNPCACGSTLGVQVGSSGAVCFDNYTTIMAWATINNEPALGYIVNFDAGDRNCGEFVNRSKTLGYVAIYAEIATVINEIEGVSQVKTKLPISESHTAPRVYYYTSNNPNRYASHDKQTINLSKVYETGVEMLIYYTAAGAATTTWHPGRLSIVSETWEDYQANGCDAEMVISFANGTEAGLQATVNLSAVDCTVIAPPDPTPPDPDDPPDPDPFPEPDPDPDPFFPIEPYGGLDGGDGDGDGLGGDPADFPDPDPGDGDGFPGEGGGATSPDAGSDADDDGGDDTGDPDSGGPAASGDSKLGDFPPDGEGIITPCDAFILGKITSYDSLLGDDQKEAMRFGSQTAEDCEEPACTCQEICESEISEKGNTYDQYESIHDQALEAGEAGSPEYNEAYQSHYDTNLADCTSNCETARDEACGDCTISGPAALSPGESAEYVCSDGTAATITMPEGACGTQSFTVGCCTFDVRSTVGQWVQTGIEYGDWCAYVSVCTYSDFFEPNSAGAKYSGRNMCATPDYSTCEGHTLVPIRSGSCEPDCSDLPTEPPNANWSPALEYEITYEWVCP